MLIPVSVVAFATAVMAARPFLNEPDNGILDIFGDVPDGSLPELQNVAGLADFDWAARNYLPLRNYTYYRNAAGGEWSYRNNMEVFQRYTFKPRVMRDVSKINSTLGTSILGHNFSSPFFIAPCARGGFGHPGAERNFVEAAAEEDVLYIPSMQATMSIEEIASAKADGQVTFQQLYAAPEDPDTDEMIRRTEESGAKAIVFTVDAPANGDRQRAYRERGGPPDEIEFESITWEYYHYLKNKTSLPFVLKGIMSVEDAQAAVENEVPAIMLSNHGGRQLDQSPSALEVAIQIYRDAPEIFEQTEVYADGGVRYGSDILKFLALGVKAVGVGRPFMYANIYGKEGVLHAIRMLKRQVAVDAANLGVRDLSKIDASYVNWTPNNWFG